MDTGITVRPTASIVQPDHAATPAAPEPVATELPAAKAVTAPATRNDVPDTSHQVVIDPQTREVIYRVIDVRSRQVIRQVPDEALLRVRAYARALANGETPSEAQAHADLTV
jgi:hypothetical protein